MHTILLGQRLTPVLLLAIAAGRALGADIDDRAKKVVSVMMPEKIHAALKSLDTLAAQTLKTSGAPGLAIAVVSNDQTIYAKGFGVRKAGQTDPVDADTVFQLASVSKPITATVLAAVVEQGVVRWDDLVIEHDPNFTLSDTCVTKEVTLRDLLCHRSGLPDHAGDLLEDLGYERPEILHRLRYLKLENRFRAQFAYTNFGFSEAAFAASRAAGKPWEELAAEMLYRPLGMNSTSSHYEDFAASDNRAFLHVRKDGKWNSESVRNADAQSPAGGVSSSVKDVAKWMRLQLNDGTFNGKQVVASAPLAETHRPQIISHAPGNPAIDRASFYGLGWNVNYDSHGRVHWNHSGGFELGAATVVHLVPSERLGIVVLTNASPIGVPETIASTFCDLVLDGKTERNWAEIYKRGFEELSKPLYGTTVDYRKPPEEKTPALGNSAYLGKYQNDFFGPIEIRETDGSLCVCLGPKQMSMPLEHFDGNVFFYQPVGEMSGGLSGVTFTIGPGEKAVKVVIENLDVYGQGTFTRAATKK
jgi:CubicO group peptidase (beta-lactamase class C family)